MSNKIERKKGESFDAFLRRTKRLWLRSGKILEVRRRQNFKSDKSKNMQNVSAVRREKLISKTTYLQRIGRIPEELNRFTKKK